MNKLDDLKLRTLKQLPFFHSFLSQCNVNFVSKSVCPTAFIKLKKNGTLHISICEEYYDSIAKNSGLGVLQHEILHLIHDHLKRHKGHNQPRLLNVAMDIAINQLIENTYMDVGWMTPERFGFERDKTTEWYYLKLLEKAESYSGENAQDDHEMFESECSEKFSEAIVKEITYKAYKQNHGNVSSKLKEFLDEMLTPPTIPWQTVLRRFIGMNLSNQTETSRTRPNRRLGLKASGLKKEYKPKIAVFEDQSGSVDNDSIAAFKTELVSILKTVNSTIDCFAFDTDVEYLGAIDSPSKINKERQLAGGTSFVPIFEEANKLGSEIIIIFTDGYGEMPTEISKKPVLWVLNHNEAIDLPGTVLRMGDRK